VEPQVCQFIDQVANSLVRLEVLLFFVQNPSTTESPEGIAWRIYREVEHIREAMEHLAHYGVLEMFDLPGSNYRLYALTENPVMLDTIRRVADYYYNDAERRIEIVRRLVTSAHRESLPA
jgi:hypothetical protein